MTRGRSGVAINLSHGIDDLWIGNEITIGIDFRSEIEVRIKMERIPEKEKISDREKIPEKNETATDKIHDTDKKIQKKPRQEGDQDGTRTPYQPGRQGVGGSGSALTPRDTYSLNYIGLNSKEVMVMMNNIECVMDAA